MPILINVCGYKQKTLILLSIRVSAAEEEGFEPPVPCGTLVFKTSAFDHSATPLGRPDSYRDRLYFRIGLQMYIIIYL